METQWFSVYKDVQDTKSSSKLLTCVFWDKDGILSLAYDLEKGATIIAKYYVAFLDKPK
jgi:hypothetical protein